MLSANDLKILAHLRQNARMPLTKMSRQTHIPVSTIFDKMRSFEDGLVIRHTALIDFQKLGYSTRVNISIKVGKEQKSALKEFLAKNEKVNSVYQINNGYDFMIEGIFREVKEMQEFIEQLESNFAIIEHKSHFIIEDVKRESFLSDADLVFQSPAR